MKISKQQHKAHLAAMDLVHSDRRLNYDERLFIVENYHEGASHVNSSTGAFFTPMQLAQDFAINVGQPQSVIDLCAGIGRRSFAINPCELSTELTCVEIVPEYVAVGKRVLPHARWICADVLALTEQDVGCFDFAVSNPPFGHSSKSEATKLVYRGGNFEFRVIETASKLARYGVFILPQSSCPFKYSGAPTYEAQRSTVYERFASETGIQLEIGVAVDTKEYQNEWHGANPICEIVVCDFPVKQVQPRAQYAKPLCGQLSLAHYGSGQQSFSFSDIGTR